MKPCTHSQVKLMTEPDGCYWVKCMSCKKRGPKRHSAALAITRAIQKLGAPLVLLWHRI